MKKRYQTCAPFAYGELERLAGILDRIAFWRGKSESQARAEIHARIRERIGTHQFSPCWHIAIDDTSKKTKGGLK